MSTEPSDKINFPPEVFIETSIHLARLKDSDLCKKIDGELKKFAVKGTSTYVKLEYGNNILHFATYCLNKLEKEKDLEKLKYHINNVLLPRFTSHRKIQIWFFNLLSKHFNAPEATERAIRTLRMLLLEGTDKITDICDDTIDGINCIWANQDCSSFKWRTPGNCSKKKPSCCIDKFFMGNLDTFNRIRDFINNISPDEQTSELVTFAGLIGKYSSAPTLLKNWNSCSKFADAIIAVQSRQGRVGYSSFFTQNIKESNILCQPLKQLLLYLPQKLDDPIAYYDNRR